MDIGCERTLYNVMIYLLQILAMPMIISTMDTRLTLAPTHPSVSVLHWEPTLMAVLIITGLNTNVLQELYGALQLTSAYMHTVSLSFFIQTLCQYNSAL